MSKKQTIKAKDSVDVVLSVTKIKQEQWNRLKVRVALVINYLAETLQIKVNDEVDRVRQDMIKENLLRKDTSWSSAYNETNLKIRATKHLKKAVLFSLTEQEEQEEIITKKAVEGRFQELLDDIGGFDVWLIRKGYSNCLEKQAVGILSLPAPPSANEGLWSEDRPSSISWTAKRSFSIS